MSIGSIKQQLDEIHKQFPNGTLSADDVDLLSKFGRASVYDITEEDEVALSELHQRICNPSPHDPLKPMGT